MIIVMIHIINVEFTKIQILGYQYGQVYSAAHTEQLES